MWARDADEDEEDENGGRPNKSLRVVSKTSPHRLCEENETSGRTAQTCRTTLCQK